MLAEPKIDKQKLKEKLEEEYSLKISEIKFIPKGEASWNY